MSQEINNNDKIDRQTNIGIVKGDVIFEKKTRWQMRFERLQEEVKNDDRYASFIEEFNSYNTILDGVGLEQKLKDAGFSAREILRAMRFKEKYTMRVVMGEMFLTQQKIDVEIFSIIDTNFETHIFPMIISCAEKNDILKCLMNEVVQPLMKIINEEGQADDFLNYNATDILGMVYFLTGKCHLNWKDYDSVQ